MLEVRKTDLKKFPRLVLNVQFWVNGVTSSDQSGITA
jgi:hypothetical protein